MVGAVASGVVCGLPFAYRTFFVPLEYQFFLIEMLFGLGTGAAERSDLEKSRFMAAASHDLRKTVHATSLFLGLLANDSPSEHGRYLVDNITRASAAMRQLFEALRNISRLDAGEIHPQLQNFTLDRRLLDQIRTECMPTRMGSR